MRPTGALISPIQFRRGALNVEALIREADLSGWFYCVAVPALITVFWSGPSRVTGSLRILPAKFLEVRGPDNGERGRRRPLACVCVRACVCILGAQFILDAQVVHPPPERLSDIPRFISIIAGKKGTGRDITFHIRFFSGAGGTTAGGLI